MAHEYILANLLAENDGAVGTLFLDETGETVDFACSEFGPYQMKVLGAYVVVLVQRGPAVVAKAKRSLAAACEQLTRELFVSS
jgi:hypothetical protein